MVFSYNSFQNMDLKMELGGYVHSAPNTKRFVVEDSSE